MPVLAHDLGTTGDKASLYGDDLELIGSVTVPYPTSFGPGGRAEQDPRDWWEAVCRSSSGLLARYGVRRLDCVSFSGQMMGAVLLDRDARPLRPAIIWADTRSTPQCARLLERVPMERAYAITGHRLNPTYSLSKIMWVRDNELAVFRRCAKVVQAKDFIACRLTGVVATDPSDASSTNAFDQRKGAWSEELLEAAGLPSGLLPPVRPSTSVIGEVHARAAEDSRIPRGTPVVIGGGDGPCAAVGAGAVSPASPAYCYLGSSSWISFAERTPLHDPAMRTMTFNHVVPGLFVPTATMQAGGASVQWAAELTGGHEDPSRWLGELGGALRGVEAALEGLVFLPHLLGERFPHWNPLARGALVGLARHHGPAHVLKAVMEGVALNLRTALLAFARMGRTIDALNVIGGGARSEAWLKILADVWGVPVRRRNPVEEANGLGAALTGAVAVGLAESFAQAGQLSRVDLEVEPDPHRHELYAEVHARFEETYTRLETLFGGGRG